MRCNALFKKSSLENEYDQPYDRYSIHFNNKILDIIWGDTYPVLDKYALNGTNVRGLNIKISTKPLLLNIIKGNTNRVIQGDPSNGAIVSEIDSTADSLKISLSRNNYTFQQELFAVKMSTRISNRFYWDLNYIKVEDNISTVVQEISDAKIMINMEDSTYFIKYDELLSKYQEIFGDKTSIIFPSNNWSGIKPKDNFIYGSNIKLK